MNFTNEDIGVLLTTDGGDVWELTNIETVPVYTIKNLRTGQILQAHLGLTSDYKRLVPEVPKRKYERKATKESVLKDALRTAEEIIHGAGESHPPRGDSGNKPPLLSDMELFEFAEKIKTAGREAEILAHIRDEYKVNCKTIEKALTMLSPTERAELCL